MVSTELLATELTGAVARGELRAVYQPQFDVESGRAVAVEALARWEHPTLGVVGPDQFIPVAEQTDVIHSLGRFMIDQALDALVEWRGAGLEIEVAVNVSAAQLSVPDFYDGLDLDLARGLPPGTFRIEVTESQPVIQTPDIANRLKRLGLGGLGLSIDDYGTGYSVLEQLDKLPATELKIDRSMVQDDSPEAIELVRAITELAHQRKLLVVAEGVETLEQLFRARVCGCDRAQGYLLARPVERSEVTAYFD